MLLGLESVTGSSAKEGGNSGSIHIYGQDLTEFNRVPFFSMVGQESDLFRGLTLQENIQYGEHTLLRMELLTNGWLMHRLVLEGKESILINVWHTYFEYM